MLKFTSSFGSSILRCNRPAKRLSAPAAQAALVALAAEVAEVAEVVASVVALEAVKISSKGSNFQNAVAVSERMRQIE